MESIDHKRPIPQDTLSAQAESGNDVVTGQFFQPDLLAFLIDHFEVERVTLGHFPPDNPHRERVRCACGHLPSVKSWDAHLERARARA